MHLAFKYKIDKYMWYRHLNCLIERVNVIINIQINMNYDIYQIGSMICELSLNRYDDNHILDYEERRFLLEYVQRNIIVLYFLSIV